MTFNAFLYTVQAKNDSTHRVDQLVNRVEISLACVGLFFNCAMLIVISSYEALLKLPGTKHVIAVTISSIVTLVTSLICAVAVEKDMLTQPNVCLLIVFLFDYSLTACFYCRVFAAFDRFLYIRNALRYHDFMTTQRTYSFTCFTWIFSLVLALTTTMMMINTAHESQCQKMVLPSIMEVFTMLLIYVLPSMALVIIYCTILYYALLQIKELHQKETYLRILRNQLIFGSEATSANEPSESRSARTSSHPVDRFIVPNDSDMGETGFYPDTFKRSVTEYNANSFASNNTPNDPNSKSFPNPTQYSPRKTPPRLTDTSRSSFRFEWFRRVNTNSRGRIDGSSTDHHHHDKDARKLARKQRGDTRQGRHRWSDERNAADQSANASGGTLSESIRETNDSANATHETTREEASSLQQQSKLCCARPSECSHRTSHEPSFVTESAHWESAQHQDSAEDDNTPELKVNKVNNAVFTTDSCHSVRTSTSGNLDGWDAHRQPSTGKSFCCLCCSKLKKQRQEQEQEQQQEQQHYHDRDYDHHNHPQTKFYHKAKCCAPAMFLKGDKKSSVRSTNSESYSQNSVIISAFTDLHLIPSFSRPTVKVGSQLVKSDIAISEKAVRFDDDKEHPSLSMRKATPNLQYSFSSLDPPWRQSRMSKMYIEYLTGFKCRVFKLFLVISLILTCNTGLWLPFVVLHLVTTLHGKLPGVYDGTMRAMFIVGLLTNVLDPLIFGFMNFAFRQLATRRVQSWIRRSFFLSFMQTDSRRNSRQTTTSSTARPS